jgi:MerR family transcriptional regulator, light-induced transcriptional regulator
VTGRRGGGHEPAVYAPGSVARRLGISPATLRTWHHRYGVGPTARSAGGHRRYGPDDLARLEEIRRLVLAGMPVGEAARSSPQPPDDTVARRRPRRPHPPGPAAPHPKLRELVGVCTALDEPSVARLLDSALRRQGVVEVWNRLVLPVLERIGARYERRGDCIDMEHLFSGVVQRALSGVAARRQPTDGGQPVLLACPDGEQHALPLHALAAALAEAGCATRVLGASVPAAALASAVRRIGPRAVFVWAQSQSCARAAELAALPRRRAAVALVVGGPGWRDVPLPARAVRVDTLGTALEALLP